MSKGMRAWEKEIWHETQAILKNTKLRLKDILEWSTGFVACDDNEIIVKLSGKNKGVSVCVKKELDKR